MVRMVAPGADIDRVIQRVITRSADRSKKPRRTAAAVTTSITAGRRHETAPASDLLGALLVLAIGYLVFVAEVAHKFLAEPGVKRGVVGEILNGQAHDGNPAALPLQVTVPVVYVAARAAMVGPIGFHDQDTPPARYQDIRTPGVA
jgi:hypothetical protein